MPKRCPHCDGLIDESYLAWKSELNRLLQANLAGSGTDDIPDQPYADMFGDGKSPITAAAEIMDNLGRIGSRSNSRFGWTGDQVIIVDPAE